jgi:hypothetical protein
MEWYQALTASSPKLIPKNGDAMEVASKANLLKKRGEKKSPGLIKFMIKRYKNIRFKVVTPT